MKKLDCKILIVDDNEELLEALEMFLSPHFKVIEILKRPDMALSRHQECNFDIILLDIRLPDMSGYDVLARLKHWRRYPKEVKGRSSQIPVLAMTAYAMESEGRKCLDAGASDVLVKPFYGYQLVEYIKRHI